MPARGIFYLIFGTFQRKLPKIPVLGMTNPILGIAKSM
jgi:hypothetical protein